MTMQLNYFARCFLTPRLRGSCRTKTTAIVKEALAPHFLKKATISMAYPYSLMIDESNDKTNKSCIILVRVFDPHLCDVVTRFLDMPVVNIANARNLFDAVKLSLTQKGLDFSKTVAFISDTTNVMKGRRSGVQRLIILKTKIPPFMMLDVSATWQISLSKLACVPFPWILMSCL